MGRPPLMLLPALCVVCGCAAQTTYRTQVRIAPAPQPGQYRVRTVVYRHRSAWWGGQGGALAPVTMTCLAGRPAEASVTTNDGASGLVVRVDIPKPDARRDGTCRVLLLKDNAVLHSSTTKLPLHGGQGKMARPR